MVTLKVKENDIGWTINLYSFEKLIKILAVCLDKDIAIQMAISTAKSMGANWEIVNDNEDDIIK